MRSLDGLRQLVATITRGSSAAHLAASIEADLGEYRDGLPRDDTAILVVQVPESPGPTESNRIAGEERRSGLRHDIQCHGDRFANGVTG